MTTLEFNQDTSPRTDAAPETLLQMLPVEDREEARQILEMLPYPAHRLFEACQRGAMDCFELKSALQKLRLDCPHEDRA